MDEETYEQILADLARLRLIAGCTRDGTCGTPQQRAVEFLEDTIPH